MPEEPPGVASSPRPFSNALVGPWNARIFFVKVFLSSTHRRDRRQFYGYLWVSAW